MGRWRWPMVVVLLAALPINYFWWKNRSARAEQLSAHVRLTQSRIAQLEAVVGEPARLPADRKLLDDVQRRGASGVAIAGIVVDPRAFEIWLHALPERHVATLRFAGPTFEATVRR